MDRTQRRIATDALKRIDFTGASVTLIARGAILIISVSLNASHGDTVPQALNNNNNQNDKSEFCARWRIVGGIAAATGEEEAATLENELFILSTAVVVPC